MSAHLGGKSANREAQLMARIERVERAIRQIPSRWSPAPSDTAEIYGRIQWGEPSAGGDSRVQLTTATGIALDPARVGGITSASSCLPTSFGDGAIFLLQKVSTNDDGDILYRAVRQVRHGTRARTWTSIDGLLGTLQDVAGDDIATSIDDDAGPNTVRMQVTGHDERSHLTPPVGAIIDVGPSPLWTPYDNIDPPDTPPILVPVWGPMKGRQCSSASGMPKHIDFGEPFEIDMAVHLGHTSTLRTCIGRVVTRIQWSGSGGWNWYSAWSFMIRGTAGGLGFILDRNSSGVSGVLRNGVAGTIANFTEGQMQLTLTKDDGARLTATPVSVVPGSTYNFGYVMPVVRGGEISLAG